jgi:hypothetical protein
MAKQAISNQAACRRYVTSGCGRRIALSAYVAAWKTAIIAPPGAVFSGSPSDSREPASRERVLFEFRRGLHARINRHDSAYGVGRKWSDEYQIEMIRAANDLNTPRLRIYYLPPALAVRFSHRLCRRDD